MRVLTLVWNKITPGSHERCRKSFFFLDLVEQGLNFGSGFEWQSRRIDFVNVHRIAHDNDAHHAHKGVDLARDHVDARLVERGALSIGFYDGRSVRTTERQPLRQEANRAQRIVHCVFDLQRAADEN